MILPRAQAALAWILFAALPSLALAQTNVTKTKILQKQDPGQAALDNLLATAQEAMDKKDYPSAVNEYQEYIAKRPDDSFAHFQLGYAFTALARPADAKPEYERAIALNPKMAEAYLNLGLTLLPTDPAAAIEPLQRAAELKPGDAYTQWLLGTAYESAGKLTPAIERYELASRLPDAGANPQVSLGSALLKVGHLADAEAAFHAALALHPPGMIEAQAHLRLAQVLMAEKKPDSAVVELRAYLETQPNDAGARRQLATVLADLGKNDEALAELDRAGSPDSEPLSALLLRSRIYYQAKRNDDAIPVLTKAAALAPKDPDIPARLGHVYMQKRDYANAARALAAAFQIDPKGNDVLGELIAALYFNKNYAAALKEITLLEQRESLPPVAFFMRAACYDKLGQSAEALDAYQKFLAVNRDENSDMYFEATSRTRALTFELKNKKR
jgi:tetratricopeptide (TPR) repeat protein